MSRAKYPLSIKEQKRMAIFLRWEDNAGLKILDKKDKYAIIKQRKNTYIINENGR